MAAMDFKKAYAHMKGSRGQKLRMWFCAQGENGKPVLLVAPPNQKLTYKETAAVLATARKKDACTGELEINADGALVVTPYRTRPSALDMGVKFVARDNDCTPKEIIVREPLAEEPLEVTHLDPVYAGESVKRAWRADTRQGISDEEREALRERTDVRTKYDGPQQQAASALSLEDGGVRRSNGKSLKDGQHGVVMNPATGRMHTFGVTKIDPATGKETVSDREVDDAGNVLIHHHSTPLAGGDVAGAGHIATRRGRIVSIDDSSGHYKPKAELTLQMVRELARQGMAVDTTMEDAEGFAVQQKDWQQAAANLLKARSLLEKYDAKRKKLCELMLNTSRPLDEQEVEALLAKLDKNAMKLEALTDVLQEAADLVGADVEMRDRDGVRGGFALVLNENEFARVRGNAQGINRLLKEKFDLEDDLLPAQVEPALLDNFDALNIFLDGALRRGAAMRVLDAAKDGLHESAPLNRPVEVNLVGKVGLSAEEFKDIARATRDYAQANPDLDVIEIVGERRRLTNALLKSKLGIDKLLPSAVDAGTLANRGVLNMLIGQLTVLPLTTEQFVQTEGNEAQARAKHDLNDVIEAAGDDIQARLKPTPGPQRYPGQRQKRSNTADATAAPTQDNPSPPLGAAPGYGAELEADIDDQAQDTAATLRPRGGYGGEGDE